VGDASYAGLDRRPPAKRRGESPKDFHNRDNARNKAVLSSPRINSGGFRTDCAENGTIPTESNGQTTPFEGKTKARLVARTDRHSQNVRRKQVLSKTPVYANLGCAR
jgi:hypothetical protein